jgi:hypothetical protein
MTTFSTGNARIEQLCQEYNTDMELLLRTALQIDNVRLSQEPIVQALGPSLSYHDKW